jgi:hypothetical protein
MGDSIPLSSYLVPTHFLAFMAVSEIGPLYIVLLDLLPRVYSPKCLLETRPFWGGFQTSKTLERGHIIEG